jgi:hypothetical protein
MTAQYTDYSHCPICLESHNENYTEFCAREASHVMCRPCQNGGVTGIPLLPFPWWLMDSRVESPTSISGLRPAVAVRTDRQIAELNHAFLQELVREEDK